MAITNNRSRYLWTEFEYKGKKYRRSTGTTNRTEAMKFEIELREQLKREHKRGYIRSAITLGDVNDEYLKFKEGTPSYSNLTSMLRSFEQFIPRTKIFGNINDADIAGYVRGRRGMGISDPSIKTALMRFAGLVRYAKEMCYDVPEELRFPTLNKKKGGNRIPTTEDISAIMYALDPRPYKNQSARVYEQKRDVYEYALTLIHTGARKSEIDSLRWSQVDFNQRIISLYRSKTDNSSPIPVCDELYEVLRRRSKTKGKSPYVFPGRESGHKSLTNSALNRAIERSGVNDSEQIQAKGGRITIHSFRKYFGSKLLNDGISIAVISKLLGHSTIQQTEKVYAQILPERGHADVVRVLNSSSVVPRLRAV